MIDNDSAIISRTIFTRPLSTVDWRHLRRIVRDGEAKGHACAKTSTDGQVVVTICRNDKA